MKLHDLQSPDGANKPRKRVGRGIASGHGKTSGRGAKGQKKRSGGGKGPYFEGGQLPLVRRLPLLRGFTNIRRVNYQAVNVKLLAKHFAPGSEITPSDLAARGAIRDNGSPVVILGQGDLNTALHVKAHRFSESARQKIEAAGGSIEVLDI
ncbi:MAG: 50S ribosomal protein L15 [Caldilineales bacterium]|nr:50S ribosomal protein L15 [Caldilineales bacterium]